MCVARGQDKKKGTARERVEGENGVKGKVRPLSLWTVWCGARGKKWGRVKHERDKQTKMKRTIQPPQSTQLLLCRRPILSTLGTNRFSYTAFSLLLRDHAHPPPSPEDRRLSKQLFDASM